MKRKILSIILASALVFTLHQPVLAISNVSEDDSNDWSAATEDAAPASDSTVVNYYYIIKNSSYVKKVKSRLSYLTDVWVKTSKYNLEGTYSATSSLSVEATSGIFTLSKIKATGKYTTSFTKSISVEVTIEADSSKFSRLAFYQEKKKYKGDLYHVANSGISKVETKVGSGYSYVPSDIYIQVVYK